jgi:hypothetical protein
MIPILDRVLKFRSKQGGDMNSKLLNFAIGAIAVFALSQSAAYAQCGSQFQYKQVKCICAGATTMAYVCSGTGTRCTYEETPKYCGECIQFFDAAGCSGGNKAGFDAAKLDQRADPLQLTFPSDTKHAAVPSKCAASEANLEAWIVSRRQQLGTR